VWLLRERSPEWRLFALNELEAMQNDSFVAQELWAAILTDGPQALQ
jgi:hypothetical protein